MGFGKNGGPPAGKQVCGFESITAYVTARIAAGMTIKQAVAESGLTPKQLRGGTYNNKLNWLGDTVKRRKPIHIVVPTAPSQMEAAQQLEQLRQRSDDERAARDMEKLAAIQRVQGTYGGVNAAYEREFGRGASVLVAVAADVPRRDQKALAAPDLQSAQTAKQTPKQTQHPRIVHRGRGADRPERTVCHVRDE